MALQYSLTVLSTVLGKPYCTEGAHLSVSTGENDLLSSLLYSVRRTVLLVVPVLSTVRRTRTVILLYSVPVRTRTVIRYRYDVRYSLLILSTGK